MVSVGVAYLYQVGYFGLHRRPVSLLVGWYASSYSSGGSPAVTLPVRYLLNAAKPQIVYEPAFVSGRIQRREPPE